MIVTQQRNRSNLRAAIGIGVIAGVAVFAVLWRVGLLESGPWLASVAAAGAAFAAFHVARRGTRRRLRLQKIPLSPELSGILERRVVYYAALDEPERERFRQMVQVFLGEVRITGIRTDVDDVTRVLVAASAVVPVFGFPDWEYERLGEVLIYPGSFSEDYETDSAADKRSILGMVGAAHLRGVMILSKPDLLHGFEDPNDKRNVGIHEFAHLVDAADGSFDGVPPGLRASIAPWREEVRSMLAEHGPDDIDPYAFTNEVEFFAVLSEYFFEAPNALARKHPEIYASLQSLFRQDMRARLAKAKRGWKGWRRRKVGRNAPCPCGSGEKYKKCCLAKSRSRS